MILFKRLRQQIITLILAKHLSANKIALSWAIGCYISFSPFPGAHTFIMLGAHFFFKLHFPLLFIATSLNNPWTMAFFYLTDYWFGYWIVHTVLGFGKLWEISLSIIPGCGNLCVWSFIVGGNLLGIAAGLLNYPLMLWIARSIRNKTTTPAP